MSTTENTKVGRAALLTGAAIFAGIVGPGLARAHAEPVSPAVIDYATKYDYAVCGVLDEHPTISGLKGILAAVMDDGFTAYESGQIVAMAVTLACPEYQPTLDRFVAIYGGQASSARVGGMVA